jgi:hypothetical protein
LYFAAELELPLEIVVDPSDVSVVKRWPEHGAGGQGPATAAIRDLGEASV